MKSMRIVTVIDIKDLRSFKLSDNMICVLDDGAVASNLEFDSSDEAFVELESILDAVRRGKDRVIISTIQKIEDKNESKD